MEHVNSKELYIYNQRLECFSGFETESPRNRLGPMPRGPEIPHKRSELSETSLTSVKPRETIKESSGPLIPSQIPHKRKLKRKTRRGKRGRPKALQKKRLDAIKIIQAKWRAYTLRKK